MLCIDNLIRLYYCYHGSFDGITKSSFGPEVNTQFTNSKFNDLDNYLYSVLGYKHTQLLEASKVAELRKEFCKKSSKVDYMNSLIASYKVKNTSQLIDILDSKGILGIQKRTISTLGSVKDVVPSKFLNGYVCDILYIIESYLDNSLIAPSVSYTDIKMHVILNKDIDEVLNKLGITYSNFFTIVFDESATRPFIKDGVLHIKEQNGYSLEKCHEYLVKLYLLGMPTIPLYLRDKFISILPRCIAFGTVDEILLDLLDFSYVSDCTPRALMRAFGLDFPNPEDMWRDFGGFFFVSGDVVYYSNPTSENYFGLNNNDFLTLVNSGEIFNLNIETAIYSQSLDFLGGSDVF